MTQFNVTMELAAIEEAHYNPRTITTAAQEGLAASLQEHGLLVPLVVNKANGRLVGGHQRLHVLQAAGNTHARVTLVDLPNEDDEIALNLILNSERARGRLISDLLVPLLKELASHPTFADTRLDVFLEQYEVHMMADDFKTPTPPPETETNRNDGSELEPTTPQDSAPDDTKYLRLHYKREEAEELDQLLAAYMKENHLGSMTEAVLQMLEAV